MRKIEGVDVEIGVPFAQSRQVSIGDRAAFEFAPRGDALMYSNLLIVVVLGVGVLGVVCLVFVEAGRRLRGRQNGRRSGSGECRFGSGSENRLDLGGDLRGVFVEHEMAASSQTSLASGRSFR